MRQNAFKYSFRVPAMERENQSRFDPYDIFTTHELSDSRKNVLQTPLPLSLISPREVS
jgi:hypothetical protein